MNARKYCICLAKETIECHIILVSVRRFQRSCCSRICVNKLSASSEFTNQLFLIRNGHFTVLTTVVTI